MAERRMFAKTIIDSDAFLDMPLSTQSLYFHLSMRADDEGFINNPKKIQRMIGATEDDLKLLIAKNFIIPFESGIVVIKHWRIHNYIRGDRLKSTVYAEERGLLEVKKNGAYTLEAEECPTLDSQMSVKCQSNVSIGKVRLGKDRLGKDRDICENPTEEKQKNQKHKYGEYKNVLLTDEELEKIKDEYPDYLDKIERLSSYMAITGKSYKSHYATIRNWARRDAEKVTNKPKPNKFNNFDERTNDYDDLEKRLTGGQ